MKRLEKADDVLQVSGVTRIPATGRKKDLLQTHRHSVEQSSLAGVTEAIPEGSNLSLLDVLFDETLNPEDSFWTEIDVSQDELSALVAKGQMPFGLDFDTLVRRVRAITVVDDTDIR